MDDKEINLESTDLIILLRGLFFLSHGISLAHSLLSRGSASSSQIRAAWKDTFNNAEKATVQGTNDMFHNTDISEQLELPVVMILLPQQDALSHGSPSTGSLPLGREGRAAARRPLIENRLRRLQGNSR